MTLFGDEPAPTAKRQPEIRPTWTEAPRGTRHRCDQCVDDAFTNRRAPIRRAHWRRDVGPLRRYYCAEHAHDIRVRERRT